MRRIGIVWRKETSIFVSLTDSESQTLPLVGRQSDLLDPAPPPVVPQQPLPAVEDRKGLVDGIRGLLGSPWRDHFGMAAAGYGLRHVDRLLVRPGPRSDRLVSRAFSWATMTSSVLSAAAFNSSLPSTHSVGSKSKNWIAVMATRRCKASREASSHLFDPKGVGRPSRSRRSMSACKSMTWSSFLRRSSPVRSASRRTSSGTLMRWLHHRWAGRPGHARRSGQEPGVFSDGLHALVHREGVEDPDPFPARMTHGVEGEL